MYECPNCGGYNVRVDPEQDFADIWCQCRDCGEVWRELFPEEYFDGEEAEESQWDV